LTWFRAAWLVCGAKNGMSAKSLQISLGLDSYRTAWTLLHKLRTAMVRPGREKLSGEIEVDETFVGGPRSGRRGRGAAGKQIVAVAVEKPAGHAQHGFGRARICVIENTQRRTLEEFVEETCEPGSIIYTDGLTSYQGLSNLGYTHVVSSISASDDPAHVVMPAVHRVASLLKRWLLGTHQGGVAEQHLDAYLDEFVFRFNRRTSRKRGLLFYRLLGLALEARPMTYETIVWSRRGQAHTRRGRPRTRAR
jgi:transposase-like protein